MSIRSFFDGLDAGGTMSVRMALLLSTGERYATLAIGFVSIALLSRLLAPEEIGVAALGLAAMGIVEAFRDFGASNYLVQARDLTKQSIQTAFTVSLLFTLLLAVAVAASAGVLAAFYKNDQLVSFIEIIALSFVPTPVTATAIALLRREMEFARVAIINVSGVFGGAVVTLVLAALGAGSLSVAWGALATSIMAMMAAVVLQSDLTNYRLRFQCWEDVVAFGGISSVTQILNRAYDALPILVLGHVFPAAVVGLFSRAQSICQISDKLVMSSIGSVALPVLAAEMREGRSIKSAYLGSLGLVTAFQWPMLGLIAILAEPLVAVLLGPQWTGCTFLVQLLALSWMTLFPAVLSYPVLVATDGIGDTLRASLISLPISALVVIVAASFGPAALAASQFLTIPIQVAVVLHFIRRRIDFTIADLVAAVRCSLLVSLYTLFPPFVLDAWIGHSVGPFVHIVLAGGIAALSWVTAIDVFDHPVRLEVRRAWLALAPVYPRVSLPIVFNPVTWLARREM